MFYLYLSCLVNNVDCFRDSMALFQHTIYRSFLFSSVINSHWTLPRLLSQSVIPNKMWSFHDNTLKHLRAWFQWLSRVSLIRSNNTLVTFFFFFQCYYCTGMIHLYSNPPTISQQKLLFLAILNFTQKFIFKLV